MGKGKEGKGRTPVPDCGSAKVAALKCGGPPTMPEENRGPWSKKFENRWSKSQHVSGAEIEAERAENRVSGQSGSGAV